MIEKLFTLDTTLFLRLNSFHHEWLNKPMSILSGQVLWVPLVLYFLYMAFKYLDRNKAFLFFLFLILTLVISDVTSSYLIKNIFERLRPCRVVELQPLIYSFGQKCGGKYGFVSSHAANSFALIHFSLMTLPNLSRRKYFLLLIPVMVAYSRIYLGVHYPGDIVGGFMVGLIWASLLSWVFNRSKAPV